MLVVKLDKLVIQNFMSVKEATLYLADKGLVSIEGVNLDGVGADSNGSGKSTIINAILWCNYGEAGKSIKADSVVNKQEKRNCFVESTWIDEENTYRITRYRKHKTEKNAVKVELLNGTVFMDITKAGSINVQNQINEILGQDFLTFQASCFAQQDEALDIPGMTDKGLKELLERVLPFDDLTEQYEKAVVNSNESKKKVTSLEYSISHCNTSIKLHLEQGKAAVELFKDYGNKVSNHNAEIDIKIKAKKQAIKVASSHLINLEDEEKRRKELQDYISKCGDTNTKAALNELRHAQREYDKWKEMYDSPDTSCALCKQETEDKEAYRARLRPNLRNLKAAYEKAKDNSIKVGLHFRNAQRHIELLNDTNELITLHKNAVAICDRLRSEISLLEGQRLVLGANPHEPTVRACKASLERVKAELETFNAELEKAKAQFEIDEAVKHTFSPKGVRYHMLESVAPTLTERTNYYLHMLTDGALSATWSTVTKNTTGEYKEKFKIDVYDSDGEIEYGAISGGEKRKVRLACFFGLQDLIAKRATKNIQLWCGDEIDHALDAAGVERLMSVLAAKTASKSSILVISHNQLRDWIPNTVVVTRKNNNSTITGYLNAY